MASGSGALTSGVLERPGPTFEGRAAVALKVVAALAAVAGVIMLAGGGTAPMSPALLLVVIAAFCCVAFVAARGIDERRPWALTAAPAMLWILIAFGLLDVLIGLGASRIQIPLGALLAIWAFRAPQSVPRLAEGRRGSGLLAGFLVANAALSVGPTLAGPSGPFAAGQADLAVSLAVDCGPADAGVPPTVPVTLRWSWSRDEPFPGGSDGIAIAWRSNDGEGGELFLVDDVPPPAVEGIVQGGAAPSADLADSFISTYGNGVSFAVDMGAQRFRPGEIAVTLRRGSEAPVAHGDLGVQAAYVHLGRWRVKALPGGICQW